MQKLQDMEKQKRLLIIVFLTVPLVLLFVFSYIPIIFNVFLGFTDWDGVTNIKMTGLRNYRRIFSDPQYLLLFRNCLWYMLVAIPQLLLSFVLAVLVNGKFRGLSVFKSILIFPYMLNGIIVAAIFITFFNRSGTLNTMLRTLGLESLVHNWLQDLKIVNPAIASISIWRYYGMAFIMFFGSLQAIPSELYESAAIDGCNKWQEIKHISVPFIKKVLFINVLLSISGSIQVFEIPYIMLGGANGTSVPVIQIQQSMGDGRIGFAAAMSIVVFFVVVISVGLQRLFVKEED
ncbi:MAG: sugar ABC transporter permease [Treponema sp.]|jgi:multiple sugar transport system permease protein|nr:sugar ABC transporter permease [Treponema sp.]